LLEANEITGYEIANLYKKGIKKTSSAFPLRPSRLRSLAGWAGQPPHMDTVPTNQPTVLLSHINEPATIRTSQPNRLSLLFSCFPPQGTSCGRLEPTSHLQTYLTMARSLSPLALDGSTVPRRSVLVSNFCDSTLSPLPPRASAVGAWVDRNGSRVATPVGEPTNPPHPRPRHASYHNVLW